MYWYYKFEKNVVLKKNKEKKRNNESGSCLTKGYNFK